MPIANRVQIRVRVYPNPALLGGEIDQTLLRATHHGW